ncbi:MAG: hypothetical protein KIT54_09770 [Phycisphaeraceae bacterium]|nr:hypothetical protein [Phycisphaeraceae bacterium]
MRPTTPLAVLACAALIATAATAATADPIDPVVVPVGVSSGPIAADDPTAPAADDLGRVSIYEHTVSVPGAGWMRVDFGPVDLGEAPAGAPPTIVRLTSLRDGAVQRLGSLHVEQWRHMSAFFNGDAVRVEVLSDPGAGVSAITIDRVLVQPGLFRPLAATGEPDSICGTTDDRELSSDPRVARGWSASGSANCTAWIIDDCMKCVLAAGHCGFVQVHFNNPLSTAGGSPVMPHPDHQYAIDSASVQRENAGVGRDWYYAGAFANPNTGLKPYEAQGEAFRLATTLPPADGRDFRVTGHGITSAPVDPRWNRAQKTHAGEFVEVSGTALRYRPDTTSGNSGSPVIDEVTGQAVAVHTHGGCTSTGGSNAGTAITYGPLQNALNAPRGVCVNPCPADFDCDGVLSIFDFLAFQSAFALGQAKADFDGDGELTIFDFLEFQSAFALGCL